jgi:hypothetical protein
MAEDPEKIVAQFYGITPRGDLRHISVYQEGSTVRLSGRYGSHTVHPATEPTIEGWKRETTLAFNISDIVDLSPGMLGTAEEKEKLEQLKKKAEARRAEFQATKRVPRQTTGAKDKKSE